MQCFIIFWHIYCAVYLKLQIMSYGKMSMDRFSGCPPDNGFDDWCEAVGELIPDGVWDDKWEQWFLEYNGMANKWLNKLFFKKWYTPKNAAILIARAYRFWQQ